MKRSLKLLRQHKKCPQENSALAAEKQRTRILTRKKHLSSTSASESSSSNSFLASCERYSSVDGEKTGRSSESPVRSIHGAAGSTKTYRQGEVTREHTDEPVASARGVSVEKKRRNWNTATYHTRRDTPQRAQKQLKTNLAVRPGPGSTNAAATVCEVPQHGTKITSFEHGAVVSRGECSGPRKTRYILFAGDLGFDTTPQQVKEFFRKKLEPHIKGVRMMTHRGTNKSKGCAFVEFDSREALQVALNYHRRELNGRKVNIELSAGGGGNSESRVRRIREKNRRLKLLRRKTFEANHRAKERIPEPPR